MNYLQALFTGFICGAVFTFFNLPLPAPPVLAGIIGIVGIWVGFITVNYFR